MKMTKRMGLLFFAALTALSAAATSCGEAAQAGQTSGTEDNSASLETEAVTEEVGYLDNLGEHDYGGYEFKLYCRSCCPSHKDGLWQEAETGDAVDDAVYQRNKAVEERFNIKIMEPMLSDGEDVSVLANALIAGDCMTDVALPHFRFLGDLALQGLMADMYAIDALDFEQPWWNTKLIKNYSIFGKAFVCYGNIDVENITDAGIILFNKQLASEYFDEMFYHYVHEGTWTIDKMSELVRSFGNDLNGDGKIEFEKDLLAFTGNSGFMFQFQCAMDQATTQINDEGKPELCINTPKMASIVDKMYTMADEYQFSFVGDNINGEAFLSGRSLFYIDKLNSCIGETMRQMTADYGILPLPKFDEAQKEYYSHASAHSNMVGIPAISPDLERTGTILEAMASEGYRTIRPAVYDVALYQKGARDEESAPMIDIVINGRTGDFADLYDEWGLVYTLDFLIGRQHVNTFASYYKSNEKASVKRLEKAVKIFEEFE